MGLKYQNAKVLVVDDNNINLYTINQLLLEYGINADCVPNGKACIKKVSKKEYDLIFMDHMMPEMDGIETFNHLKENPEFKTPVFVLTANEGDEYKEIYAKAGFAEYIVKPVDSSVLDTVLDKYLSKNESERDNLLVNDVIEENTVFSSNSNIMNDDPRRDKLYNAGFTNVDELIAAEMSLDEFDMILSIFAEESLEKMADAEEYYSTENMREYAVIVHGLKNDAGMVSDMDLREHALKHEIESKAGNIEFVREEWPVLTAHWQETLDRINSYFS